MCVERCMHGFMGSLAVVRQSFDSLFILDEINFKQFSRYLLSNIRLTTFSHYVVNISIKESNFFMHIFDSLGNQIKFYSIFFLIKLKRKEIKKVEILKTFYYMLLTKHSKLIINNKMEIVSNKDLNFFKLFVGKLRKKFLLINIKFFNHIPYNGCRRKRRND